MSYTYFTLFGLELPNMKFVSASPTGFASVYLLSNQGLERIDYPRLYNLLFYNNITLINQVQEISPEVCNIRASGGAIISDSFSSNKNTLSLSTWLRNTKYGKGSLMIEDRYNRLSLNFDIKKITLLNDSKEILFNVQGSGFLNRTKINDSLDIRFNTATNTLSVMNNKFSIIAMDVSVIQGCEFQENNILVIQDYGSLSNKRNITEVRSILDNHPELAEEYGSLERLYKSNWWLTLPPGIHIS